MEDSLREYWKGVDIVEESILFNGGWLVVWLFILRVGRYRVFYLGSLGKKVVGKDSF